MTVCVPVQVVFPNLHWDWLQQTPEIRLWSKVGKIMSSWMENKMDYTAVSASAAEHCRDISGSSLVMVL